MIILFHVTADTTWSNLPLSGLFVEMLRKIVALSGETREEATGERARRRRQRRYRRHPRRRIGPSTVSAVLGPPPPDATPFPPGSTARPMPNIRRDFTVRPTRFSRSIRWDRERRSRPPIFPVFGFVDRAFATAPSPVDLKPWLIAAAFALVSRRRLGLALALGRLAAAVRRARGFVLLAAAFRLAGSPRRRLAVAARRRSLAPRDLASVLTTRLAYVASGDARGRRGEPARARRASRWCWRGAPRWSPGDPVGVDPARDELSFYPLLYWPIVATKPQPPRAAIAKAAPS